MRFKNHCRYLLPCSSPRPRPRYWHRVWARTSQTADTATRPRYPRRLPLRRISHHPPHRRPSPSWNPRGSRVSETMRAGTPAARCRASYRLRTTKTLRGHSSNRNVCPHARNARHRRLLPPRPRPQASILPLSRSPGGSLHCRGTMTSSRSTPAHLWHRFRNPRPQRRTRRPISLRSRRLFSHILCARGRPHKRH